MSSSHPQQQAHPGQHHPQQQHYQQQQQSQSSSSSSSDKRLNTEIHQAIRGIQTALFKDDGNVDREVIEHFKVLSKQLDVLVEKTRKRPVERAEDEATQAKKRRLLESRARIRGIYFKSKN